MKKKQRMRENNGSVMRVGRRHFLLGSGGFTLALPFLESIAPKEACAGEPPFAENPRFIGMVTQHGAVWPENMFPVEAMTPNAFDVATGHQGFYGDLSLSVGAGEASLSPTLTASSGDLTPSLVEKMMVIRGLDIMFPISHNTGGALGNFAASDADEFGLEGRPTIDQVMAWSESFYPDIGSILLRSMHVGVGGDHAMSWGHQNGLQQSGPVSAVPASQSSIALFNQIFVPDNTSEPSRPLVVDRVIESYRRLRDGNWGYGARLSSSDRQKLSDQMDRLDELERRLNVTADCSDVPPHTVEANDFGKAGDIGTKYQLFNDVIVAAMICGTSRIATINPRGDERWVTDFGGNFSGNWHPNVAHEAETNSGSQELMLRAHNNFFRAVFVDLCKKLDVEEANGKTYLDNSLVMWTQESGERTHKPVSLPVVCAGSAAGYFNTGRAYDYRNRNNLDLVSNGSALQQGARPGLSYNQWLGNLLTSMGVPTSEWERPGEHGYGDPHKYDLHSRATAELQHPSYVYEMAGEALPLIVAD